MRIRILSRLWQLPSTSLAFFALLGCVSSNVDTDRTTFNLPIAVRTKITFEPLSREQASRYIETERHFMKTSTAPIRERLEGLRAGRKERYEEVEREFPECTKQRHCTSKLSRGAVQRFERYNDLSKEILDYDRRIVELEASINDWDRRLELRTRAIVNRYLVHEMLKLPEVEPRFQGLLIWSLESFDSRRQVSNHLFRYTGQEMLPLVVGDLEFRMLGKPVDEAAVIATFEVYLQALYNEPRAPTRYVVSMLVNTHQLDMRYYNKDFLREWGSRLAEPFQEELRQQIFCSIYSISSETLVPRLNQNRARRLKCDEKRALMQAKQSENFADRFAPSAWLLPIAYYPMARPISGN
jgi:hypothetical protein